MKEYEIKKYKIDSTRRKGWNYSNSGYYFITICTLDMKSYFGSIKDDKFFHTKAGLIVDNEWKRTEELRENVTLDQYNILPNHFHAIIILMNEEIKEGNIKNWGAEYLGTIINHFKGSCTKKIRMLGLQNFKWQSRFHDRIIRDEKELYNVRNYIKYNNLKWKDDRYYRK